MGELQVEADGRTGTRAVSGLPVRAVALAAYGVAFAAWLATLGLPRHVLLALGWVWLGTIAWSAGAPWRTHLAFARDWWPAAALLLGYVYSRGLTDDAGLAGVHVSEPVTADRALFGGTLPTQWLQARLCGVPCDRSSPPEWYDVLLTTVYYSHFVVPLGLAGVLWVRDRAAWAHFLRRYLVLCGIALTTYVLYPMAPPWMASRDGAIAGADVVRITGRGWWDLSHGAGGFHARFSALGNPVAAMPSLHAAVALLVAVWAITRLSGRGRWLLLLYPVAMAFALVYDGEHYVVDVLAGGLAVVLAWTLCTGWERTRRSRPD